MCKCLREKRELLKTLPERNEGYKDKEILDVEIGPASFFWSNSKIREETTSEVTLTVRYKNKKGEIKEKKQKTGLTHAYCPFCGKAYKEELSDEEI
jgi:hypothetical protein